MTIVEAGAALRSRKVSCRELAEEALASAHSENARLNAFMTITEDSARKRAAELGQMLDRGVDLGPLHGIPIAHKDCLFTKGVRTTWGSKLFADFIPDRDAEVVERLIAAGAVSPAQTGLQDRTYHATSHNPHVRAARHPSGAAS